MALMKIKGCVSNHRKEITDFEDRREDIYLRCNHFLKYLQNRSVKNPLGSYTAFWYLENSDKKVTLHYGVSNLGYVERGVPVKSDLEDALKRVIRGIDVFCGDRSLSWEYFVFQNGTGFFSGWTALFTSNGVGIYGDSPKDYAKGHCSIVLRGWESRKEMPLHLIALPEDSNEFGDQGTISGYVRRDIIEILLNGTVFDVARKYGGFIEYEDYTRVRLAFNIDRKKCILEIKY